MERARADEQDEVRLDGTVFRCNRGALDDRQNVSLHALARNVRTHVVCVPRDLVDLVQKDDAVLFGVLKRFAVHVVRIDALFGFLLHEDRARMLHRHPLCLFLLRKQIAEHAAHVNLHAARAEHHGADAFFDLNLHDLFLQKPFSQAVERLFAKRHPRLLLLLRGLGLLGLGLSAAQKELERVHRTVLLLLLREQQFHKPLLGCRGRRVLHKLHALLFREPDRLLHKIAHHALDVSAHIADLGVLRGFDLDKRRVDELCKPSCDLGFADAGRPEHDDILRRDLLPQFGGQTASSVTVSERDRHRALCFVLTDDIAVQCVYDFSGRHGRITSTLILPLVKIQIDSAIAIASQTISSALISVCIFSAFAAASA